MCFLISCTEKEYHFCDIPDQKPNHNKAFNKLKDILQSKWTMLFNSGKHMRKKKDGGIGKRKLNEVGALSMKFLKWNKLDKIKDPYIVQLFLNMAAH